MWNMSKVSNKNTKKASMTSCFFWLYIYHDFNIITSCRSQMFFKLDVFKNFRNFTGKHLCWSLFLIKSEAFRPATLLKRDSNPCVFLWNLWNFWEHLFLKNTSGVSFCIITIISFDVIINPFHANDLFLYLLETLENQSYYDVFRRYRKNQWYDMG